MLLTVAICTRNRSALLHQALECISALEIPPGTSWEVLVVNNNSTDNTDAVLRSFAASLPLRPLFQPVEGLSHARNMIVREARGDYIVWTDDDAFVEADWLAAYSRAFERWPDAAFFGGPVDLMFEAPPPDWVQRSLPRWGSLWGLRDLGPEPIRLTSFRTLPYGMNWAIKTSIQQRQGYDPQFGHGRKGNYAGEEIHLMRQLIQDGEHGRWVPEARVRHHVAESRMTTDYINRVAVGWGRYFAATAPTDGAAMWFNRPRWAWRRAVQNELIYRFRRIVSGPEVWIGDLIEAGQAWGFLSSPEKRNSRLG